MFARNDRRSVIQVHKGKGKANPLQIWTGPEVCKRLGFTDF